MTFPLPPCLGKPVGRGGLQVHRDPGATTTMDVTTYVLRQRRTQLASRR